MAQQIAMTDVQMIQNKIAPGICGCGAADTDSDSDGTADCNDGCPNDPNKVAPGICGCGTPDTDTDNDGTADCNDGCPNDPNKVAPGDCGCGVADTDTDNDGTADCIDDCPNDPNKIAPGDCGCGIADTDSDNDGTADCIDGCPSDPNKIAPDICGCGVADTDSDNDGTADCNDGCPDDPDKIAPGICGCGVADTDTDNDGTADCNDGCPDDPNKITPGDCGCGIADTDSNNDGISDCLQDPTACETFNFNTAPTGLFEDQSSGNKTQLFWDHYSDASDGCIIRGGTIGTLDVSAPFTQNPGNVLVQGNKINGLPDGLDYSALLDPDGTFILFNAATFPSGFTGAMVPGAFYKWQVRCGCVIDPSLPLPDRLNNSNVILSPWSDYDLFTNLSLASLTQSENDPTNGSEFKLLDENVELYPNPFEDQLTINLNSDVDANSYIQIDIWNFYSQHIANEQILPKKGSNKIEFNTENFERGIYFINIAMQEKIITHKVVKY